MFGAVATARSVVEWIYNFGFEKYTVIDHDSQFARNSEQRWRTIFRQHRASPVDERTIRAGLN